MVRFHGQKLDRNFPAGPVVKKAACNAGDVGSILGQRAKFPHVTEELNLGAAATESWALEHACHDQSLCNARKILHASAKTRRNPDAAK